MIPKINILHGELLEPFFNFYVESKYPGHVFPTKEEVLNKISSFKREWEVLGGSLLSALYQITKKTFLKSEIDVYVVNSTPKDMSSPIIIRSRYTPEEFMDTLIHELIHVFLRENKIKHYFIEEELDKTVKNHINLFALLTYLYKDVLKDLSRLEKNKEKSNTPQNVSYKKAWEIVDSVGYMKIIESLSDK